MSVSPRRRLHTAVARFAAVAAVAGIAFASVASAAEDEEWRGVLRQQLQS